jgi:Glycosyl transferase family 2
VLLTSTLIATLVLAFATILLLLLGKRLRFASRIVSLLFAGTVSAAAAWVASRLWGLVDTYAWTAAAIIGGACLLVIVLLPYWNPIGQLFLGSYLAAAGSYLALGSYLTFASGLSVWGRLASLVLLLLEFLALLLSGYFAFEGCDRLCRVRPSRTLPRPDPTYLPKVSLQVPAYNEPADMVIETVKSLERIDYPNLEILVVDNNTPDPETWAPVKEYCEGRPGVRFVHIVAEGFKAGALNVVMDKHLAEDVELIGIIDADYQVDPGYLNEVVGYFADPQVAFVQTPQDYREWQGDTYLTAC